MSEKIIVPKIMRKELIIPKKEFKIVLFVDCLFKDRDNCCELRETECTDCIKEAIEKESPCFEVRSVSEIKREVFPS